MKNIKVGARLGMCFALLVAMLLVTSVISVLALSNQSDVTQQITNKLYPKAAMAARISLLATDMGRVARNVILRSDQEAKLRNEKLFEDEKAEINTQMIALEKLIDTDKGRELLNAAKAASDQFLPFISEVVTVGMQGKSAEATTLLFGERYKTQATYLASLDAMNKFQAGRMAEGAERASDISTHSTWIVVSSTVIAILLATGLAYLITRSITVPLAKAVLAAHRVAKGDLSTPILSDSRDETGQLLDSLQSMQQSLSQTVGSVRSNAESVATASAQIAQGNTDLSQRTEEQAAALEETAASMEQLTATVKQNADNAQQGSQLAKTASQVAGRGGDVVSRVVDTMQQISDSSGQVRNIITVIEGIAFQTNILALNAAVEAARAGEQGRGFAVVAGEVRTLAQRSASAAKEIKDLIGTSVERVTAGTKLVDEAGATMHEVVQSITRVSDIMEEISAASIEQRTGIEQVNQAVSQMDEVTQQNAALVEEASAAAQSMSAQSNDLRETVSFFKLATSNVHKSDAAPALRRKNVQPPSQKLTFKGSQRAVVAVDDGWNSF